MAHYWFILFERSQMMRKMNLPLTTVIIIFIQDEQAFIIGAENIVITGAQNASFVGTYTEPEAESLSYHYT